MSKKRSNVTNVTNPQPVQGSFQTFRKFVLFEATFRCRLARTNPKSSYWPRSRFGIRLGTTLRYSSGNTHLAKAMKQPSWQQIIFGFWSWFHLFLCRVNLKFFFWLSIHQIGRGFGTSKSMPFQHCLVDRILKTMRVIRHHV